MQHPRPIKVLDLDVANKIAAGEVVERPSSVVKELVENAIDAGATDIRVEVRGGGLQSIRVVDNGWGMSTEGAEMCFQRHATSKIESADDLTRIETLGFRGEALPSIAAVARVTIVTRQASDEVGTFVTIENTAVVEKGRRGCPVGTAVAAQNLFKNIPARLKYVKSAGTEAGNISHLVSQFALAYPEIRFTLITDGRMLFQSVGDGSLFSALVKVYGVTTADAMVEIHSDDERRSGVKVWGFVGGPGVSRSNRNCLSFFVNRRWVQSRALAFAVEDACRPLLPEDRHAVAVVNIEVRPDEVDVNVHPSKSEVRFLRDREVFFSVQNAIRCALAESISLHALTSQPDISLPSLHSRLELIDQRPVAIALPLSAAGTPAGSGATEPPVLDASVTEEAEREPTILRVIGQMAGTFIITEGPSGMYLVDQHRAHERVLFDRLGKERVQKHGASQLLLDPVVIELAASQVETLEARLEELSDLGFAIERFGEGSFLVRGIPSAVGRVGNLEESIAEMIEQAAEDGAAGDWQESLLATMACKGAIKAGQALTLLEMRELLLQLEATSIPSVCPHGGPIMVHLSQAQLEKQFGR
ncbi:MAG: DNA mismatch repair endonuclease MutL [Chloroflexi bacterium]|nr:DNA mismatch repair endonuclease MutL [Chloroflexota bacterium]